MRQSIETKQKALEINLDNYIYGTFAEIGAGQEVVRHFFRAGAAAGTIAKAMSAYDKKYSDEIYGAEIRGRYVCQSRLYKMLQHEFSLMQERLTEERPDTCFFAFADTISALNFRKTNNGHGWMGVRFQLRPNETPNDVVIHVKMKDNDTSLQQQAIGVLGVNLLYACYRYSHPSQIKDFIGSLLDGLRDRVEVDMMHLDGRDFDIDSRLLSLYLVQLGLTDVAMFDSSGINVHPSEVLYKKNLLVVRGSYRPTTLVNMDMIETATEKFKRYTEADEEQHAIVAELTLENLALTGEIDDHDFLDRATLLCAQGQSVIVSNCEHYKKLLRYFADYRIPKMGLVVGFKNLQDLVDALYRENKGGKMLSAFGDVFMGNVRMYVYPLLNARTGELLDSSQITLEPDVAPLYQYLLKAQHIEDLDNADRATLGILSYEVLKKLRSDEAGWEQNVPEVVAALIRKRHLFGFPSQRLEFEY